MVGIALAILGDDSVTLIDPPASVVLQAEETLRLYRGLVNRRLTSGPGSFAYR